MLCTCLVRDEVSIPFFFVVVEIHPLPENGATVHQTKKNDEKPHTTKGFFKNFHTINSQQRNFILLMLALMSWDCSLEIISNSFLSFLFSNIISSHFVCHPFANISSAARVSRLLFKIFRVTSYKITWKIVKSGLNMSSQSFFLCKVQAKKWAWTAAKVCVF